MDNPENFDRRAGFSLKTLSSTGCRPQVQRNRDSRSLVQSDHNGRGDALVGKDAVERAIESTRDFVDSTYAPAARVAARNGSLKDAWEAVRESCDPKFKDYAIYEHCLPFNVSRAYDEARGIDHPRIWTDKRDLEMWAELQG